MPTTIINKSVIILLFSFITAATGCSKSNETMPAIGNSPRKDVPGMLIGEWMYKKESGTLVTYPDGRTVSTYTNVVIYIIKADGTGSCSHVNITASASGETTHRTVQTGTFEIELAANNMMTFKFYPLIGKIYDNGIYAQLVDPGQLYPHAYINWVCKLGTTDSHFHFVSGDNVYVKK